MKSKMSKKLIAFILCMVLVICNSVSILADTPAPETATVEKQVKETKTANDKKASDDEAGDTENVSPQSEESAPEVKTTEKKEETTEATTQKKDEADEVTTKAKEETEKADETTTEAKETTKKEETTETQEEKTTKAKEETSETSGKKDTEKTTEAEEKTAPTELTYDDENVTVTVSAVAKGAIPADATLKVVPILKDDTETKDQYTEVEQKIQEKAAETETEIKGFLAYDITFVDADGNEIEPNSEVKVSMEYKEAALPAEITAEDAKTSEVSVMHLEEDDAGNVSKVVDMSEAGKVDTLETTDAKQVEKVEVKTESFSVFTIYWGNRNRSLDIQVVDTNGTSVSTGYNSYKWLNSGQAKSVEEIAKGISVPEGYTFQYARIGGYKEDSTEVLRLRYNDDNRFYKNEYSSKASGNDWERIGNNEVYFVFTYQASELGTINTVDSRSAGITLNLFDYSTGSNYSGGINTGRNFLFNNGGGTGVNDYVGGEGEDAVFDGIFKRNMAGSAGKYTYPVFSDSYNSGSDASYLFAPSGGTGKIAYPNVNHLFIKDSDGYYRYDSSTNFAYYNKAGENEGNFTVYDVPAAPDGPEQVYMKGSFFPFNVLADNSNIKDSATGLRDFTTGTGGTSKNTHFGMTMSASFVQPAEGKVNGQNMVFNFSGDDDVWVFIDGVLVLDIGGIHDALAGSIDFNTGTVKVTGQQDTNLEELFQLAGRNTDGFDRDTFADYTEHTINFYYLERGEGTSNCKLEFNIQTVPTDKVIVEKQLGVAGITTDEEFTFKVETSTDGEKWTALTEGTEFTINNVDGTGSTTGTIGQNGSFTLKPGQRAEFSEIAAGTYFRASETPDSEYNTEVRVIGADTNADDSELSGRLKVREGINQIIFVNTPKSSSQLLSHNKTAEAADYEDRVYKVNLSAGALGSTAGTEGESASIVLCLDASDSLNDAGVFDDVQDAAKNFIATAGESVAGENSGNVEIAVVWYNGNQVSDWNCTSSTNGFYNLNVPQEVSNLDNFITNKTASGGTPMGAGLEETARLLNSASYPKKYVLFFTDGMPGYFTEWGEPVERSNCMVANSAYNEATDIKNNSVTIYTVGYGNMNTTFHWQPGHSGSSNSYDNHNNHNTWTTAGNFLSDYIASENCAFLAGDTEELNKIFTDIAGSLGSNLTMQVQSIKDIVDERFNLLVEITKGQYSGQVWQDPTTDKRYRLAKDGDTITDSIGNSGEVSYDEKTKTYTIIWSNVTIPNVNDKGWSASFYVKAKEDFMGGNMVPTNGPESGIYVSDGDVVKFPMPTVNVKLLTLQSEDKEVTYFKGESINPKNFIQELLDTAEVVELVNDSTGKKVTIPVSDLVDTLTDKQLNSLAQGNSVDVNYSYGDTDDIVGTFTLQFAVQDNKGQLGEHRLDQSGDAVEKYVLTVTYTAKNLVERQSITDGKELSTPGANAGTVVDKVVTAPKYIVNVVAGSITVRKTLSVEDLSVALEASENKKVEFTFTINGTNDYSSYQKNDVTITFTEEDLENLVKANPDATEITKSAAAVSDLAQDIYTVSENAVNGFEAQHVVANGLESSFYPVNDVTVDEQNLTATLQVGLPKASNIDTTYINYRDGEVTFTNSKVITNWQIVKVSSSGNNVKVANAIFELKSQNPSGKTYIGTSADETGVLTWTYEGKPVPKLDKGTYILKETQAPGNYLLSNVEWIVEITSSGALKSIKVNGDVSNTEIETGNENGMVSYYFVNEVIYDLPSAGGSGIYWYTVSGALLMMGAALIVYREKRKREVLLRK